MPPRDAYRLAHMLEYAREAIGIAESRQRADLETNRLLELALLRLLETLGEAASKVSPEMRALHPQIPWSQVISLRNRLIHGYDSVDHQILWQIIKSDLPVLAEQLASLLSSLDETAEN